MTTTHAFRFAGKKAVVTGAAQGIGLAVARRLAAESAEVVLVDRSETVREAAEDLKAHAVLADLETYEGAQSAVAEALGLLGRIDVLVNNVGGTIWAKPYEHYAPDEIQAEIQRSLFPTLWTARAALPHLIAQRSGTVVNVSSIATRGVHRIPYSAAKGGINALTASLAMEVAPYGIRVVATAAGGTDAPPRRVARGPGPRTEQEKAWYERIVDQTIDSSLMKRYGTPEEQAAAICFLASDEASYITGTVLPVGGGDLG
ncbi:1,6-dihydroxycyclohexa-2,4-diene-1-carboxylate dehydrogenase [Streptomyces sp. NPDC015127]|uniref:1,6-dihydroxycyclohexa-2,4-diene-1-carboxylate dehydrogenase n=1 Tax=Streptomyces sp. NPDC015127 TaxID=3364939 RepID=UPI0036F75F76